MGKNDKYAVWRCDIDHRYSDCYIMKPHFFSSGKKKIFQVSKYTKIFSNHFEYDWPVEAAPNSTLFLKGYDGNSKVGVKGKAPTSKKKSAARTKILRKEPVLKTKNFNQRKRSCNKHQ